MRANGSATDRTADAVVIGRHNGKVEPYNRILTEEFLYARPWKSEHDRTVAHGIWNIHYSYHRPHSASGGQPPNSRLTTGVTNLLASYT